MASQQVTRRSLCANAAVASIAATPVLASPSLEEWLESASPHEREIYHAGQLAKALKDRLGGEWMAQFGHPTDGHQPHFVMLIRKQQ